MTIQGVGRVLIGLRATESGAKILNLGLAGRVVSESRGLSSFTLSLDTPRRGLSRRRHAHMRKDAVTRRLEMPNGCGYNEAGMRVTEWTVSFVGELELLDPRMDLMATDM